MPISDNTDLQTQMLLELERYEQETEITLHELLRVQGEHRARLLELVRKVS